MFTKLMAVLIAAVLVFGGAAATASAAQGSLPVDALYPVKTLGESVALGLSFGSVEKLDKALEHAQRRVNEMAALIEMGVGVPAHVSDDFVEGVEYALRLAAKMSDTEMALALEKIQRSLQVQLAGVEQLRLARPGDMQLAGLEFQLQQRIGLVELGLSNPQMFREQLAGMLQGSEGPSSTQDPSVTEEPSVTPAPGDDNSTNANSNDTNSNDANSNGDDSNTNDDNANNNDDSNTNSDDDANSNDEDGNTNDDDDNTNSDDDSNTNGDDDSNGNGDDDSNTNSDDDSNGNTNDDDSNTNGDDDSNGNSSGGGVILNPFFAFIARIGGLTF